MYTYKTALWAIRRLWGGRGSGSSSSKSQWNHIDIKKQQTEIWNQKHNEITKKSRKPQWHLRKNTMKSKWPHNDITKSEGVLVWAKRQGNHDEITNEISNEIKMKAQWIRNEITNEITMDSQWNHNEINIESQRNHNDITMESQLNHY